MDLRIFVEPQQGASYAQQLAVAQRAEALGFDAFFRSDHFLKMGDVTGLPGPTDSWVTLGAIARETSTIRLGTLVTSASFRQHATRCQVVCSTMTPCAFLNLRLVATEKLVTASPAGV